MDSRQQRGMQIAANGGAIHENGNWRVWSQTGSGRRYRVNPVADTCTCPDHEETNARCKHVWAVIVSMTTETDAAGATTVTTKVTYGQSWSSYNRAQVEEKDTFLTLLADLCKSVPQPPQAIGRPRLGLDDMAFATTYKVFSGFSSRRFSSDLRDANERGLIARSPHFNSVTNYMANPDLTPILYDLISRSSLPLRAIESDFAVDSSGFSTCRFDRWFDAKHGAQAPRMMKIREWVKAHIMVGVHTNVVTAAQISPWMDNDSKHFPSLVRDTAANFDVVEVSGDKAYLGRKNLALVESIGATPFVPFKSNSKPVLATDAWGRMYHRFMFDREVFMAHYHKRSNVETTFAMVKSKFGDSVMSKSTTGQTNEVLCKLLAHNIVVVGQSAIEFGIDPTFAAESAVAMKLIR